MAEALGPVATLFAGRLAAQCRRRAPLFAPERGRAGLHRLVDDVLIGRLREAN